jgi:hypothetical protein
MRSSLAIVLLVGCANDPVYIPAPMSIEAGVDDGTGMIINGSAQLMLPIKTETAKDAATRAMRTAALNGVEVPYVKVGDLELSVEWTIRNLDTMMPGTASIQLNGANEVFAYVPDLIMLDAGDEEAPDPPGLAGGVPLHVDAAGTISGLFREDQLREASIDLDQITRGNVNPFHATLTISKNADFFQPLTTPILNDPTDPEGGYHQDPVGDKIPREAFRQLIRIDLVFKADRHMVLEYTVRIRDTRGIMHDLLEAAVTEAPGELTMFMPADYTVSLTP